MFNFGPIDLVVVAALAFRRFGLARSVLAGLLLLPAYMWTLPPVTCRDCGARNLHAFFTSARHGYHLCPTCFETKQRRGFVKADDLPTPDERH